MNISFAAFAEEKSEKKEDTKPSVWTAHIIRAKKNRIDSLNLIDKKVPVYLVAYDESFRPYLKIVGQYSRKGWTISLENSSPLSLSPKGYFEINTYLNGRLSKVALEANGPSGESEKETLYVFSPQAREMVSNNYFKNTGFKVGHSYLDFSQSSFGNLISQSLYLEFNHSKRFKKSNFGYALSVGSTVYTYHSSPIPRSSNFIDSQLLMTYAPSGAVSSRFSHSFAFGAKNINLISLGEGLGFSGLIGAQSEWHLKYFVNSSNSLNFEIGGATYSLSDLSGSRSLEGSFSWTRNLDNQRMLDIGLKYQNVKFSQDNDEVSIGLTTVYIGSTF